VGFVLLASIRASPSPTAVTPTDLLIACAAVSAAIVVLSRIAVRSPGRRRNVALAAIGALGFGFGSALLRLISQSLSSDPGLFSAVVVTAAVMMVSAMVVGGWAVQQAYVSGPAAVVVGCLTVGDPLVAVILGLGLLGEGGQLGPGASFLMIVCATGAAVGVALLARHHPEATSSTAASLSPAPLPRPRLNTDSLPTESRDLCEHPAGR